MGDTHDFDRFFRAEYPGVVGAVRAVVRSPEVAEEIAQEGLLSGAGAVAPRASS